MNRQKRTWFPVFLVIGVCMLMLAAGVFPRRAEAAVTIECEILVEDGDTLMPGQPSAPVVAINFEEDGEAPDVEPPVQGAPAPAPGPPVIVYLDPNAGGEGAEVTIFGWNFDPGSQVTFDTTPATVIDVIIDPEGDDWDQIVILVPAGEPGPVDVTVTNPATSPNVGSDTLPNGWTYLFPSPYPGLPGSSTVRWVEVIISTNILDHFQSTSTGPALIDDFRGYLDSVINSWTLWVDGYSELEDDNGVFFLPDDRPLEPLVDLDGDNRISQSENDAAEVYENFIPGSRGRVFSFARNAALGATLRAAMATNTYDPPVTVTNTLLPRREVSNNEFMDQIVYRFACAWPRHITPPGGTGTGFVEIGPLFDIPGLGWPPSDPGGYSGLVPEHTSNQYIGPAGEDEANPWAVLFEGNDYYVTLQPGCAYPQDAILNIRVTAEVPPIPFPRPGFPAHPPGIQTDPPPPDPIDGCETESSIGTAGVGNFVLNVDPVPYRTTIHTYSPEHVLTRIRPDVEPTAREDTTPWYVLPRIIQMEYPTAVIAINVHGGDPPDNPIYLDRITVTFTDIGGGAQFGRPSADTFAGDGDFNPWFGLDSFGSMSIVDDVSTATGRPPGFRGVEVWKDANGDGEFDPESDIILNSEAVIMPGVPNPWEPFFYVREPGNGAGTYLRDDPEWTIVLDLATNRILGRPPRTPWTNAERYEALSDDNIADFAMEAVPEDADDPDNTLPDFFVTVQVDSGYVDTPGGNWRGDGTGIRYGADFRAYIKPEIMTNPNDPLNLLVGGGFPAGISFSIVDPANGGLGCDLLGTTMPEIDSPPYSAVMQTHDYVVNMEAHNNFSTSLGRPAWETVPFFVTADDPALGGPRSPFFPVPPTFLGSWSWDVPPEQWPKETLYEERNYFEDGDGSRVAAQRIDSLSRPTAMLGLNLVNTPDASTLMFNNMKVARIECFIVSEDHLGPTGFEPSDLLAVTDDGLGDTGISLWQDSTTDGAGEYFTLVGDQSSGVFEIMHDTQVPLMLVEIGDTPVEIDLDGIDQGRPDMWGYPVVMQPVHAINVVQNDVDENEGDDLFIVIQTSDTISYKDKIEVVIPYGGVVFQPTGFSAASGTVRHDMEFYEWSGWYAPPPGLPRLAWYWWPFPIEYGDAAPSLFFDDYFRSFGITQLLANVPTELTSLVRTTFDTDADGVADALSIGPEKEYAVMGIDIATLNEDSEVYLEYLVVEFYNQGGDEAFSPSVDLKPFTANSAIGGIGLYRDNPNNKNGVFSSDDIPIQFDDPPDLIGVSGETPIQVRMTFSSPGTDNWAGINTVPVSPYTQHTIPLADQPELRQLVPTTFGRSESGTFIAGHSDAGNDFFVVIRTSNRLGLGDDFSVGIVSWGPDTLTAVDPDTFTAPPAPRQPSDEYEKFEEHPWATRGIGFIETPMETGDPVPASFTSTGGFNFLRTRATVQLETDVLYATSGVLPPGPPGPPTPGPGPVPPSFLGGGGGGGGCLIATAAFGTRYEEHVVALTTFRDRYLLTNAGGAWLVKRYYSLSPRPAEFVARHEVVRAVVRQIIRPVSAVARLCIETSGAGKTAILFGAALLVAALIKTRRTWRSVRVRV